MLKRKDIIDIVSRDGQGRKHLRRVKVHELRRRKDRVFITGVNMQGKFPMQYNLPLQESAEIDSNPNTIGWFHFKEEEEIDA